MNSKMLSECRLIANALENILAGKNPYYQERMEKDPDFRDNVSMALAEERNLINQVTAFGV